MHILAHFQPIAPELPLGAAAHIQRAAPAEHRANSSFIRVCFPAISVQWWTRAWSAAEEPRSPPHRRRRRERLLAGAGAAATVGLKCPERSDVPTG